MKDLTEWKSLAYHNSHFISKIFSFGSILLIPSTIVDLFSHREKNRNVMNFNAKILRYLTFPGDVKIDDESEKFHSLILM